MTNKFNIPTSWTQQSIKIHLIGAGGNGSHMLDGLTTLHHSLLQLGHPHGLEVVLYDPDQVSESNIVRAQFYKQDVGLNKAIVLINRANQFFNLYWKAQPRKFTSQDISNYYSSKVDLIITCVDSREARRNIHHILTNAINDTLWLDLGNDTHFGNCILGQPKNRRFKRNELRLPTVIELFPEMLDETKDPVEDEPSCSVYESLERQGLFINKTIATFALYLIGNMIRNGGLDKFHGNFINMENGSVTPLPIDQTVWDRMTGKRKRK